MSGHGAPRKRVIVIGEDDAPIAMLLRDAINDEPAYRSVIVADGAMIMETVRQERADLLILDLMLPGLNGIEVFDRVRQDRATKDLPVLFVTAARGRFEKQMRERNVTNVIAKPFDLNVLLDTVRSLCPADRDDA
ncbi:MAG: response regulator [Chloroflexota bacterium]|nr:response regulator [Chloroflexota bacterium]